jgi:hypothetical protein
MRLLRGYGVVIAEERFRGVAYWLRLFFIVDENNEEWANSGVPLLATEREKWAPLLVDLNSQSLLSAYGVAVAVAHFVAFEVFDVVDGPDGVLAASGMRAGVSVVGMEMIIDVAVKTLWTVEPGANADEDAAAKPLRAVVTIGSAVVGWDVVVAVGTYRCRSDFDGYLSLASGRGDGEADCNDSS